MNFIPQSETDKNKIYEYLNINSIDELFINIPLSLLNPEINIANGIDEITLKSEIKSISELNTYNKFTSFLGAGAYNHYIPSAVNEIIKRQEFYTAYTPYQPEMSQGMLQAIFEFQTMICQITGLDVSNASLYDGATAIAEAILIAVRTTKKNKIIVLEPINPKYKQVLKTYSKYCELSIDFIDSKNHKINYDKLEKIITKDTGAIISQYPNFLGVIEDLTKVSNIAKDNNAVFITAVNPISLSLFETPANMGSEIIVGEGQALGIPLSFGGPYLGFVAIKENFLRQMPGRIVGQTIDKDGKIGYVLTIQTREQHIRREKATSNICSNQALMALSATVYLAYMGKIGLKQIAEICFSKCFSLKEKLKKLNHIKIQTENLNFNEFVIECDNIKNIIKKAKKQNIIPGLNLEKYNNMKNHLLIAVTEKTSNEDMEKLFSIFKETSI